MRHAIIAVLLLAALAGTAVAGPFEDGLAAYERGDYTTALREFRPLAEQGLANAQFNLGLMYRKGQGVPQDDAEAARWYRKAAEQGDADAQYNLGVMYNDGQGVAQDYAEAVRWYRRAAEQDDAAAQVALGVMYGKGHGMPQDYVQAHKWYNLAASRLPSGEDRDLAVKNRDIVAPKMTAAQIAEAQRLARDWKPKTQAAPSPPQIDYWGLAGGKRTGDKESETVRGVQLNLATLGYKPGPADGILGPRTRRAVEAFQRDQGLPVTGEVSAKMQIVLLREMARQKAGLAPTKVELSD